MASWFAFVCLVINPTLTSCVLHAQLVRRHQPDLLSFNLALSACARKGEAQKTLRLLGDMRKAGLLPTTVSFSTAVKSCEMAGRADEVRG